MAKKAASARGLFRATGKTAKPVPIRDLTGEIIKGEATREKDDFNPTPPEPTRAIIYAEQERLRSFDVVWEAAAGDGAMVREMLAAGLRVYASDLVDRGCGAELRSLYDYRTAPARAMLTNPPFQECNVDPGWIRHSLETLGLEYMCLLLPVNWMGSGRDRAALWRDWRPARIYVMRWRIDFTGGGAPPMLNAWYVWDRTWVGEPVVRMLDRADARQAELLGGGLCL